jgi:hypothetical protein
MFLPQESGPVKRGVKWVWPNSLKSQSSDILDDLSECSGLDFSGNLVK